MGSIFYLMGKSSSGKDTIFKELMKDPELKLHNIVLYTTRPLREGEKDGVQYHFVDEQKLEEFQAAGKVIELRSYHTVRGIWKYFTVDDGQTDLRTKDYLAIGTLESYRKLRDYFGRDALVPLYIQVEDGLRLSRALERERMQECPQYEEMCRRFLADAKDFSEEKIREAGIRRWFSNEESLEKCVYEVTNYIKSNRSSSPNLPGRSCPRESDRQMKD